ncbi:MAG: tetraacyldisaccharide 4'-kinase [Bdellovibrionales bacterium]|nr:tetraacyldisaccharide 4'-kinase [Bdellovibrionales bacterium]
MIIKIGLSPFYLLYKIIVYFKNQKYNQSKNVKKVDVPIISVGNLTVGGTGKTAIVGWLIDYLLDEKIKVGLISRGYKGEFSGVEEVVLNEKTYFGDEPTMLKFRYPEIPIFVGKNKFDVAAELIKHSSVQLIIADDAFQHRKLKRDLDVVLLDVTEDIKNYELLPWGKAREPFHELDRAHVIIFTKVNLDKQGSYTKILEKVKGLSSIQDKILLRANFDLSGIVHFIDKSLSLEGGKNYALLSALGNPAGFEASVVNYLKTPPKKHFKFSDHHNYESSDMKAVMKEMREEGIQYLVTSQKDAVKLGAHKELHSCLYITQLDVKIEDQNGGQEGVQRFFSHLSQLYSQRN